MKMMLDLLLGSWRRLLNSCLKELITEHVQGATEDNSCIVTCLKSSYKEGVCTHSMRVVCHLLGWVMRVG